MSYADRVAAEEARLQARALQEAEEWIALQEASAARTGHSEMPLDYLPNHARKVRATEDAWITTVTRSRMYEAIAASDDPLAYATVKVTRADGSTSRIAAGELRPNHRRRTRKVTQARQAPEASRLASIREGEVY